MFCQSEPGLQTPVLDLPQFGKCFSFGLISLGPLGAMLLRRGAWGHKAGDLCEPPSSSSCLQVIVTL